MKIIVDHPKIIILIGLIMFYLSGIYLYRGYNHHISLIDQVVKVTTDKIELVFDSIQEFSYAPYSARINNVVTNHSGIVAAFASRDKEILYERAIAVYKDLIEENKFFQIMNFYLPNGTIFLQMHNYDLRNDYLTVTHSIVPIIHKGRKPLAGYEVDQRGLLLQIIQPIFYMDDYIGTLEFGIQVDHLLDMLERKIDAPIASFFRYDYPQNITNSHDNTHTQFRDFYLVSNSQEIYNRLPETLEFDKGDQRIVIGDQTFIFHSHSLSHDCHGKLASGIVVLQDISPLLTDRYLFFSISGVFIVALFVVPLFIINFGGGRFICLLMEESGRDVKTQKQIEQKLHKAEKLGAIGLLAGSVAHDLNNILSGIVSYSELLRLELSEDSDMQEPLLKIQKAGMRAADVVANLLTMTREVALVKEIVSLNYLVREYLSSPEYIQLSSLHPKVTINTQLEQDCWNCRCSPTHIVKSLMNLVTNATESIVDNGTVTITTYNHKEKQHSSGDSKGDNEFVILEVRDTGVGIPPNHLERIFEPFYSSKKMGRSGTGLGLSIVWDTIIEHGGLITVDSDKKGSVFTIYLPVCEEHIDKGKSYTIGRLQKLYGDGLILVVGDDENRRLIARKMLSILGYTVHTATSGEEAVTWSQNNNIDLLVLDMKLDPDLNGIETYQKIIELYPNQKMLIVSGLLKSREMAKALQLGVKNFISKPYSVEELGYAVQQVITS